MKKITAFLLITFFSAAKLSAGAVSDESVLIKLYSQITPKIQAAETGTEEKSSGYKYEISYPKEKIKIEFFKKPHTEEIEGLMLISCIKDNITFSMIAPKPAAGKIDAELLFSDVITGLIQDKYKILYQKRLDSGNQKILKITCVDHTGNATSMFQVHVTPYNFYMYGADYRNKSGSDAAERFIKSFKIS